MDWCYYATYELIVTVLGALATIFGLYVAWEKGKEDKGWSRTFRIAVMIILIVSISVAALLRYQLVPRHRDGLVIDCPPEGALLVGVPVDICGSYWPAKLGFLSGHCSGPKEVWLMGRDREMAKWKVWKRASVRHDGTWNTLVWVGGWDKDSSGARIEIVAVGDPHQSLSEGQDLDDLPKAKWVTDPRLLARDQFELVESPTSPRRWMPCLPRFQTER
jgi:hypothetical protein